MKLAEAEHLLGGYATGTLTDAERTLLLSAALDCQELFDALVDEEALRELLADPVARAQLLAALTPAPPKIIPFWRRTGVLGAAASLLVASIAGLAYLRSPEAVPPVMREGTTQAPAAKAVAVPTGAPVPAAPTPAAPARKAFPTSPRKETALSFRSAEVPMTPPPAPAPQSLAAPAAAMEDATRLKVQAEARDALAKKTEAPRPAAVAMVEVVAATQEALPEPRAAARNRSTGRVPGGVPGGVIGGVVGGVAGSPSPSSPSPSSSAAPKAKALGGVGMLAATAPWTPTWTLDPQPDGSLRVMVTAPRGPQVVILKRGRTGTEALKLQAIDEGRNAWVHWRGDIRLAPGDVLDLYGLNAPVTDPLQLPETGPVDGFRARIHPASKKRPVR